MDLIVTYIKISNLSLDPTKARKVKIRLSRFTILNDELCKRGFSQPYLKCLDLEDTEYVLKEIHEKVYGNHSGPRSLVGQVVVQDISGQQCKRMQLRPSRSATSASNLGMCNMSQWSI